MKRYRVPLLIALVVIVALAVFVGIRIREATDGTYRTQRRRGICSTPVRSSSVSSVPTVGKISPASGPGRNQGMSSALT